jgi:hypothetical protein
VQAGSLGQFGETGKSKPGLSIEGPANRNRNHSGHWVIVERHPSLEILFEFLERALFFAG